MAFCQSCGSENDEAWEFCPGCGTPRRGRKPRVAPEEPLPDRVHRWLKVAIFIASVAALGWVLHNVTATSAEPQAESANYGALSPPMLKKSDPIGTSFVPVPARTFSYFPVEVTSGMVSPRIMGTFEASGGSNDIRTLVLDQIGFINFSNGNAFRDYYDSGVVTVDQLNLGPLAAGEYYVVFSNRNALITDKMVHQELTLNYLEYANAAGK